MQRVDTLLKGHGGSDGLKTSARRPLGIHGGGEAGYVNDALAIVRESDRELVLMDQFGEQASLNLLPIIVDPILSRRNTTASGKTLCQLHTLLGWIGDRREMDFRCWRQCAAQIAGGIAFRPARHFRIAEYLPAILLDPVRGLDRTSAFHVAQGGQ